MDNGKIDKKGDDKWSLVVCFAMIYFIPISPIFDSFFNDNKNERKFLLINLGQSFFAIIALLLILICDFDVIYNVINETKPYGREFWINLYILTMSVTVLTTMFSLWSRQEDLHDLVFPHELTKLTPIKIDVHGGKKTALVRTATLYLFLTMYHVVNKFTYDDDLYVATLYSFLIYIGYNNVFIIYIVLCWMMCARFRNLNLYIKSLTNQILVEKRILQADKHHLQKIADWYFDVLSNSISIEKTLKLNDLSCSLGIK